MDTEGGYDRPLRGDKTSCTMCRTMSGLVQFAGFYFYAYLGPARDRLGMG